MNSLIVYNLVMSLYFYVKLGLHLNRNSESFIFINLSSILRVVLNGHSHTISTLKMNLTSFGNVPTVRLGVSEITLLNNHLTIVRNATISLLQIKSLKMLKRFALNINF